MDALRFVVSLVVVSVMAACTQSAVPSTTTTSTPSMSPSTSPTASSSSTTSLGDGAAAADSPTAAVTRAPAAPPSVDAHASAEASGFDAVQGISIVDTKPVPQDSDLMVVMMNQAMTCDSLCSDAAHNVEHASRRALTLDIQSVGAPVPGSYSVSNRPPPPSAHARAAAFFAVADADCREHTKEASSGTIVVKGITPASVSGTYDLVLETGDHLSGSFAAPRCDRFMTTKRSTDAKTCRR
jgi:hypothetical protein